MPFHYENVRIEDKQGAILGFISSKRSQWYLKRGLATAAPNNGIVLNFEPKGRSEAGLHELIGPRQNKCVVCGTAENLTRHHLVPYAVRRHMPLCWKSHNSYDVVPLCEEHHRKYTIAANALQHHIQRRLAGENAGKQHPVVKALRIAKSMAIHGDKMPVDAYMARQVFIEQETGYRNLDKSTLELLGNLPHMNGAGFQQQLWKAMSQDMPGVIRMWCRHFYRTMHPQHMTCGYKEKAYTELLMRVANERTNGGG